MEIGLFEIELLLMLALDSNMAVELHLPSHQLVPEKDLEVSYLVIISYPHLWHFSKKRNWREISNLHRNWFTWRIATSTY